MTALALAAFTFTAMHLLISGTRVRDVLVVRLGEGTYRGLFSLASAAVLAWLIWAYAQARQPAPTTLMEWRWLAATLLFVAFLFIVLGLFTRGPTIVGAEYLLKKEVPARGIHRVTRHPFLWGIALWAAVHAAFNPETVNLVFFGTFVVVAGVGTFSLDAKRARMFGEAWQRYAAQTSNIPFAAIAQKRNQFVVAELALPALGAVLAAFVAFALLHARFFGLAAF